MRSTFSGVVVGDELGTYPQDVLFGFLSFGQGAFEQLVDAVSHEKTISVRVMCGITELSQRVVGSRCQVGNGVEQCTVEVEYYQFLHLHRFYFLAAKVTFSGHICNVPVCCGYGSR